MTYSNVISERSVLPNTLSIPCELDILDSKASVFTLIIEDNSKKSSEVPYWEEQYRPHVVNVKFKLIIFKI